MKRRTICASAPFKSIPIEGKPNHYYEASIYYAKGGMNYLSGESVQRGYLEFSHAYLAKAYEKKVGRA